MKVIIRCENCGSSYERTPSVARYSRFCSAPCRIEAVSASLRRPLAERFWEKVSVKGPDDCWEWTGGKFADGYGAISVDGKPERASRVSAILDGRDPQKLHVRHSCDNPPCVNPKHLLIGTAEQNMEDKVSRGRQFRPTKLTNSQVKKIRMADEPLAHLANKFGVSVGLISLIRGKSGYRGMPSGKSCRKAKFHP